MSMKKITNVAELKEQILWLEIKQANEARLLKEQFKTTLEDLRPVNLIKKTFKDLVAAPELKEDLLATTLSMAAGFLTKKIVVGATHNPIKMVLGALLQMGVTAVAAKNSDGIKSTIMDLINKFSKKNKTE
jgi:hypothetical protein